jgi:hypothetical protein
LKIDLPLFLSVFTSPFKEFLSNFVKICKKSLKGAHWHFLLKALSEAKQALGPSKNPLSDKMTIYESINIVLTVFKELKCNKTLNFTLQTSHFYFKGTNS